MILTVLKQKDPSSNTEVATAVTALQQPAVPVTIEVTEAVPAFAEAMAGEVEIIRSPDGEIVFESSPESEKELIESLDDRNKEEATKSEEEVDDLYNLKNFSL